MRVAARARCRRAPGDIAGVTAGTGLTGGGTAGDVTLAVNPAVVQSRVTTACPSGQALRSIAQDGTAVCESISGTAGGDITGVTAGAGLTGGGPSGDVSLAVEFGGPGSQFLAARADHTHAVAGNQSTAVGLAALANNTASFNTALGATALLNTTTGFANTAVGAGTLAGETRPGRTTRRSAAWPSTWPRRRTTPPWGRLPWGPTRPGASNTAVGTESLRLTTTGGNNVGVGRGAGRDNVTGSRNTLLGTQADVAAGDLVNATAIGADALVGRNDSIVLGSIAGVNTATSDVNVGIGTTTPFSALSIERNGTADLRFEGFGAVSGGSILGFLLRRHTCGAGTGSHRPRPALDQRRRARHVQQRRGAAGPDCAGIGRRLRGRRARLADPLRDHAHRQPHAQHIHADRPQRQRGHRHHHAWRASRRGRRARNGDSAHGRQLHARHRRPPEQRDPGSAHRGHCGQCPPQPAGRRPHGERLRGERQHHLARERGRGRPPPRGRRSSSPPRPMARPAGRRGCSSITTARSGSAPRFRGRRWRWPAPSASKRSARPGRRRSAATSSTRSRRARRACATSGTWRPSMAGSMCWAGCGRSASPGRTEACGTSASARRTWRRSIRGWRCSTSAGEVEGVKYDRLTTVLVNAVKELEELVRTLREEKGELERRLTTLEGRMTEQTRK